MCPGMAVCLASEICHALYGRRIGQGLRVDGLWVTVTGKGAEVPEGPNGKSVDPTRPMVALTFDDGPSKYTPRILDSCQESHPLPLKFTW